METPDLIHAAQHGNLPAFNHLISNYQDMLYTLVLRITAGELDPDPIMMAIVSAAYHNLQSYHQDEFQLWLVRIAVRECRQAVRKGPRRAGKNGRGLPAGNFQETAVPDFEQHLRRLSLEQRLAVALVDLEKMEYAQAARVSDQSVREIRRHLGAARLVLMDISKNGVPA
jgi:DNA-directed RNA polymerase specialized sigma24 family protein